ncbi:lactate racemase domain-containing protein [Gemmata sp. JC717]|uniref:lactate racemase domain-containing protein n=1 Tax=Gemmata algarum TaxID=2975278 RepID=UPI0021BA912D|nr:lactate racemase domain-containing protein [Gemmata algarum]MDY3553660.1 lactate racemase domain-containing protein [Gemmata algarum]
MFIPRVQLVRQTAPQPSVADVAQATRETWLSSSTAKRIRPGMKVAVACGSRGINNYLAIAKATVDALKELGAQPFVVAAMGSHGGATSAGQRELLASYRIDEQHLGVPVVTDMDAENIGANSWGQAVWWDKNALKADAVVTVSRVKPHTDFRGTFESGILKMLVIGLGKRHGADQVHSFGTRGLRDMIPESGRVILAKTPFVGGLAIIENAKEETARLEVVDRDDLWAREPELLIEARGLMGRLPFPGADVLIIGECGKNYSGAGMDPNVVGRMLIEATPEAETNDPRIVRIGVLDVSAESHGNATGIGIADLTTNRALAGIDPGPFRMNNLTARSLWRSKLPIAFDTDREVIGHCVETCWQPELEKVKLCVIPNTLEVVEMWLSEPLLADVRGVPHLEFVGDLVELPFDANGNLMQEKLFPHSVRGRRVKGH